MLSKIKNNFFTGLVVIFPLVLTILIFVFLSNKINDKILSPLVHLLRFRFDNFYWTYIAKALSLIIIILLLALIGQATRLLILRNFFGFWEKRLMSLPMVGKIYLAIKEISSAFLGQEKHAFAKVVLIEFPRKGIYSLGFVTAKGCKEFQNKIKSDTVHVFIPNTPNPTTGFFLVVPKEEIIPLEMSVTDGFRLIVSGGAISPPENSQPINQ